MTNSPEKTFVALCLSGEIDHPEEVIYDFVAQWHRSGVKEQRPIYEYLGFTQAEYRAWVEQPASLSTILRNREAETSS